MHGQGRGSCEHVLEDRPSPNSLFPKVEALYQEGRLADDMRTPSSVSWLHWIIESELFSKVYVELIPEFRFCLFHYPFSIFKKLRVKALLVQGLVSRM